MFQKTIEDSIENYGFAVMGVGGNSREPMFSYTVGLTQTHGLPEVLVFGLSPKIAHQILWAVVLEMKNHKLKSDEFEGFVSTESANFPLVIKQVGQDRVASYVYQGHYWAERHGVTLEYMQLVMTDKHGKFPWDEGYDPTMKPKQPELWV